jgi:hypothetical protein
VVRLTKTKAPLSEAQLFAAAHAAGMAAGNAAVPTPMTVVDTISGHVYLPVAAGVCGFAWINVPGNSAFGRYAKKRGYSKGYPSGINIWVREFGQSYERKMAYAQAFAAVLKEAGVKAYASGRLD